MFRSLHQYVTVMCTFVSPATEALKLYLYPPQFTALKGVWCWWMKEVLNWLLILAWISKEIQLMNFHSFKFLVLASLLCARMWLLVSDGYSGLWELVFLVAHYIGCTTYISANYIAKVGHHYDICRYVTNCSYELSFCVLVIALNEYCSWMRSTDCLSLQNSGSEPT